MYLLYLDESGNENDPSNRYFVLAGLALFERQIHHLNERLDRVQEEHFPNRPPIPFHASAIRAGRGFWRGVSEEKRQKILDDVITAITATDNYGGLKLYAAAIEKDSELYGERAVEAATEQVCKRFDTFLSLIGGPGKPLAVFHGFPEERARLDPLPLSWFDHPRGRTRLVPPGGTGEAHTFFASLSGAYLAGMPDRPSGPQLRHYFRSPELAGQPWSQVWHVFACIHPFDLHRILPRGAVSL